MNFDKHYFINLFFCFCPHCMSIVKVTPGSPAHRIGVNNGDHVTHIGDSSTKYMTSQDALNMMLQHGDTLILTLER